MVTAPAKRELVRYMAQCGLSERQALRAVRMSRSALCYQPKPDGNIALREHIIALAQRHHRYGAGMIYLKLRQAGWVVNHKRVAGCTPNRDCRSGAASAKKCRLQIVSRCSAPMRPIRSGRWTSCLTGQRRVE